MRHFGIKCGTKQISDLKIAEEANSLLDTNDFHDVCLEVWDEVAVT